ncbi:MAG: PspC domain-containing protein [Cyclobacteriaceae bacterium]|nr:PspC domain-containing protein [Cyclobacteriaceae bacterium]
MKKNISINISGIIFHIEEDGYEKLKEYLDTIHRYFASYDDSSEIIADIENRIAEIFLSKLKEGKQVITIEDVEALMATMGGIKDFKEVEMEEEAEYDDYERSEGKRGSQAYTAEPKRLFRDEKRKILGGVLSGIAYYFRIDPLWVRLIFIVMFFGVWFLPATPAILTVAYIVLWIVVPGTYDLDEQKKVKKMFRNPDDKVLGGVSSGIAAYFGIDIVIVRLLFIVLIFFGGTGLVLYIILWIILPEARTITDKMEMQGEPVTLRNIESNIKKSLKVGEDEEESIWAKILLFPFRLIAAVIQFISRVLGPVAIFLVEAIRVIFGIILVLTAMGLTLAMLITAGIALGLLTGGYFTEFVDFPVDLIRQELSALPLIAGFFAGLIPCVFLVFLGVSIITRNLVMNAKLGWSLFSLWIISLIILLFTIPPIVGRYTRDGVYSEVETFSMPPSTTMLDLKQVGLEDYEVTSLRLRGHEDSLFRLEKRFEAVGKSRLEAIENARMVEYHVNIEDSVITFDSNIQFLEGAKFRGQQLEMTLYIPYNKQFQMDYDLKYIVRNTIYFYGFRENQMEGNTWMFTAEGLECITCSEENDDSSDNTGFNVEPGENTLSYDMKGFESVQIASIFNAEILQADQWEVMLKGDEEDLNDVRVIMENDNLKIDFDRDISNWDRDREKVYIYLKLPEMESLELSGAVRAVIRGFSQDLIQIDLSGAAIAEMDIRIDDADIDMDGMSKLTLYGNGEKIDVTIAGASRLDASDYAVNSATIDASGVSHVKVNASEMLEIDVTGGSEVRYSGDPQIQSERAAASRIIKE